MNYIIDETGRQIFSATKAQCFKDGLCAVQVGGRWGYINTSGKVVIPCRYDSVWPFENGAAVVMAGGSHGLINKQGTLLAPLQYKNYDKVPKPSDGVVSVEERSGNGYIARCFDIDGNMLFTKAVRTSVEFSDGLASVWYPEGYGVIDKSGNNILPVGTYDFIKDFRSGIAEVQKGTLRGFISKSGEVVVPLRYSYFNDEPFPIVIAQDDKGTVCLDARTGNEITPRSRDNDRYSSSAFMNTDGMVIIDVKSTDTVYFFDTLSCRSFSLPDIKEHWRFSDGMCAVVSTKPGRSGFIDRTGKLVITCDFGGTTNCAEFHRGCCVLNGTIINKKGKILRHIPQGHRVRYSSPNADENGYWIEEGNDILSSKYGPSAGEALLNDNGEIVYKGYMIDGYRTDSLIAVKGSNITGREKWGYINRNGKLVIPYQFSESATFSEGFATLDEPVSKSQKGAKGCYIATSVYGSYDAPDVWVLRRYRDLCLSKSLLGRAFIRCYYSISPALVAMAGDSSAFKGLFKPVLDRLASYLRSKGYSDDPYSD